MRRAGASSPARVVRRCGAFPPGSPAASSTFPTSSTVRRGSRAWFDNGLDDVLAKLDLVPAGQHGGCREVAIDGPLIEAERNRLADLFCSELAEQCTWPTADQYTDV
tara:strand:- start:1484 stop:1804 length:321 start_codon:yes stop_codon:yes gene_type:complete